MEATAASHDDARVQKGLRTKAAKRRALADELDPPEDFTDPESSIMKGADGFVQGYNAQLAVDDEAQVIVARGVTDQPPDNGNLTPLIERVEGHLDETPTNATADAGYWNPEAEGRARALGTEA